MRISNSSGGAGTITGLSKSTTTATQQTSGNLLADTDKVTIADGQTITIKGVVMNTTNEFLVLKCSVAVEADVSGWGDA